jgi:HSP20 family molecular chaperone IbpA
MCHGHEGKENVHYRANAVPVFDMMKGIVNHMKDYMKDFEGWIPHFIEELEKSFIIVIPLPGFSKQEVQINLIGNTINIKAKKKNNVIEGETISAQKDKRFPRDHFIKEIFKRLWQNGVNLDVALPENVNKEEIKSKMDLGILQIKLGKEEPEKVNINIDIDDQDEASYN